MPRAALKEKMACAKKGEVIVFETRYGKRSENLLLKVYCTDADKLDRWAQERRIPADIVVPAAGVPHLIYTCKSGQL